MGASEERTMGIVALSCVFCFTTCCWLCGASFTNFCLLMARKCAGRFHRYCLSWPLYGSLNGFAQPIAGISRLKYLAKFYGAWWLSVMASAISAWGICFVFKSKLENSQKRQVILLVLLTMAYSIYPIFSGQFWFYHWILFLYFAIQFIPLSPSLYKISQQRWGDDCSQ